jgi:hypothetical protein
MFQQLASPRRVPAFFDCFDEPGIVFEHSVDRFHNELRGVTPVRAAKSLSRACFSTESWTSMASFTA